MAKDTLTVDFETLERFMVDIFGGACACATFVRARAIKIVVSSFGFSPTLEL